MLSLKTNRINCSTVNGLAAHHLLPYLPQLITWWTEKKIRTITETNKCTVLCIWQWLLHYTDLKNIYELYDTDTWVVLRAETKKSENPWTFRDMKLICVYTNGICSMCYCNTWVELKVGETVKGIINKLLAFRFSCFTVLYKSVWLSLLELHARMRNP